MHSLAEISDRTDVASMWRVALVATAAVLPCALCREHFRDVIRRMVFPPIANIRTRLRHDLWAAHAAAGSDEPLEEEALTAMYGGGDRGAILARAGDLLREIASGLRPIMDIGAGAGSGRVGAFERAWRGLIVRLR